MNERKNSSEGLAFTRRGVLAGAALGLLGGSRALAQQSFATEVRLSVEKKKSSDRSLTHADEKRLLETLQRRIEAIAGAGGTAEMESADVIRAVIPSERVTPGELKLLCRVGRMEVRLLQNVRSSASPKARYFIDTVSLKAGHEESSTLRIRDNETGRAVSMEEFLPRCPLLLNTVDIAKDGARVVGMPPLFAVRVAFKPFANQQLDYFTKPGVMLAITLDGELISISGMESRKDAKRRKSDDVTELDLLGGFSTPEEATLLAALLNGGALPAPLTASTPKLIAR